ncbi:MAG: alpha/beta fold hydrolase [Anaerolineaceae bacterium]|nr:alpha/beta fold hydrolase [Anaerolineaceae bacterium]
MMNSKMIIPTAEPFFFSGGPTACLLIHGFTGTPKEMRWMGEYLNKMGYTTMGIRLTGHATSSEDMIRTKWEDWLGSIEDGLNYLSDIADQIVLVGLSMGGALSLLATARYANHFPISATIAMAAPHELPDDWRISILGPISPILPQIKKEDHSDWFDTQLEEIHKSYSTYPSKSILELKELLSELRNQLINISTPVCLMQSKNDRTIPLNSMQYFYDHIPSKFKQMIWVENSGHVITEDLAKNFVFKAANDFIHKTI